MPVPHPLKLSMKEQQAAIKPDRSSVGRVSSYGITHAGKVRQHNEDSMLVQPETGLWVVADGMGGHAKGDTASQMIVADLKKLPANADLVPYINDIEDCIIEVNKKLLAVARNSGEKTTIGSTVVAMLAYAPYYIYLWAGDSRLYRLRHNEIRQITTDHSQVENYIEQGIISREEALVHPHGNVITRAVGVTDPLFLDMDIQALQAGDRYLLCSDGLTKHLSDADLQDYLRSGTAEESCKHCIATTLSRGAGDNVTAIVIDIK